MKDRIWYSPFLWRHKQKVYATLELFLFIYSPLEKYANFSYSRGIPFIAIITISITLLVASFINFLHYYSDRHMSVTATAFPTKLLASGSYYEWTCISIHDDDCSLNLDTLSQNIQINCVLYYVAVEQICHLIKHARQYVVFHSCCGKKGCYPWNFTFQTQLRSRSISET